MREQIEVLEYHPYIHALCEDVTFLQLVQRVAHVAIAHQIAIDRNIAFIDPLQMVDRAQQGGFPRPRLTKDRGHAAGRQVQADIIQHPKPTKAFRHVLDTHLATLDQILGPVRFRDNHLFGDGVHNFWTGVGCCQRIEAQPVKDHEKHVRGQGAQRTTGIVTLDMILDHRQHRQDH